MINILVVEDDMKLNQIVCKYLNKLCVIKAIFNHICSRSVYLQ